MTPPNAGDLKERLDSHMGKADMREVLADCRLAAKEIDRLESQLAEARKALEATGHKRDRLRSGYGLIMNGLTEGRIKGDDVVWYDDILTLYDFCGDILGHEYGGKEEDRS